MVINANTKTATKVLMVSIVEAKYGKISQISRRKTEVSFLNTRRAIPDRPQLAPRRGRFFWPLAISKQATLGF
jgi:hypothetical protein